MFIALALFLGPVAVFASRTDILQKGAKMIPYKMNIYLGLLLALSCVASAGQEIKFFDNPVSLIGSFSEAHKFCKSHEGHVPTAREWAKIAMKLGARGIVEYTPGSASPGPDYELINSPPDKNGFRDKFYYNKKGLRSKPGSWVIRDWDSSWNIARVSGGADAPDSYWSFNLEFGYFEPFGVGPYDDYLNACIPN
jgi:hypothetical protein